jgi:hypothetical protein
MFFSGVSPSKEEALFVRMKALGIFEKEPKGVSTKKWEASRLFPASLFCKVYFLGLTLFFLFFQSLLLLSSLFFLVKAIKTNSARSFLETAAVLIP